MTLLRLSLISLLFFLLGACQTSQNGARSNRVDFGIQDERAIVGAMNQSAEDWNRADLDAFMTIYDSSATFMTSRGPIGVSQMKDNYNQVFFVNGKPKQQLRFEEMTVRPLGTDHALLLGRFVLSGNEMKELTGRYSVVFKRTSNGWKMIHDHSS